MVIGKKGNVLIENVVFLVLNLMFLTLLVAFLVLKMGDGAVLEERYAKQIALVVDSARSGMKVTLDISEGVGKARGKINVNNTIVIRDNVVYVKFREGKGYSYSFFNDVPISSYYVVDDPIKKESELVLFFGGENG